MRNIIAVNCLPMSVLTCYFVKRCKKQGYRGGIVNMSSHSWVDAIPFMSTYAGTKGFNDVFSRCAVKEVNNIDMVSVRAMMVISSAVKK